MVKNEPIENAVKEFKRKKNADGTNYVYSPEELYTIQQEGHLTSDIWISIVTDCINQKALQFFKDNVNDIVKYMSVVEGFRIFRYGEPFLKSKAIDVYFQAKNLELLQDIDSKLTELLKKKKD